MGLLTVENALIGVCCVENYKAKSAATNKVTALNFS